MMDLELNMDEMRIVQMYSGVNRRDTPNPQLPCVLPPWVQRWVQQQPCWGDLSSWGWCGGGGGVGPGGQGLGIEMDWTEQTWKQPKSPSIDEWIKQM